MPFAFVEKVLWTFSVLGLFLSKLFNGHNYDVYQISDENNRSREDYCSSNTINWQGQIRFLEVEAAPGFGFLIAGRQPGCFVSLALSARGLSQHVLSGSTVAVIAQCRLKLIPTARTAKFPFTLRILFAHICNANIEH